MGGARRGNDTGWMRDRSSKVKTQGSTWSGDGRRKGQAEGKPGSRAAVRPPGSDVGGGMCSDSSLG